MSTYTKNFRLKKPELTDTADLTQYNESWDKVDSTLKEHADKLNNTLGKLSVNGKTPNSNGEITLTADDVNAATEEFVEDYVEDKLALVTGKPLEENSISGKVITPGTLPADRLEGSLPISKGGTGATSASSAREALGITSENIGAVPLDGSVSMTGNLELHQKNAPNIILYGGGTSKSDATDQYRVGYGLGGVLLQHYNKELDVSAGLYASADMHDGGYVGALIGGSVKKLFGEHNTDLLKNYVLPLDGSVPVVGNLTIERPNWLGVKLKSTDSGREGRLTFSGNNNETQVVNYTDDNNLSFIKLNEENYNLIGMLELAVKKEGNTANYKIFGEHNITKGTTDIGAGSAMTSLVHFVYEE